MHAVPQRMDCLALSLLAGLAVLIAACAPAAAPTPTAAPAKPAGEKPAAEKPAAKAEAKPAASPAAKAETKPAGPAVEIRIGHGAAAEEQLWLMAAKPEITPNQGKAYTLKMVAFRASADRLTAYEANQIDGGTITPATALFASEQGVPMKLVASVSREVTDPKWFSTTFLAMADSGIKGPKDLKGKTMGIVDFKSTIDLWSRAAVEAGGYNPETDAKYVVVPFPAMGEALRSKRIDVGAFPQPFHDIEVKRGGMVEVFKGKTITQFDEDLIAIYFRPEFLQRNQAAIKAFLSDLVAATKFYLENSKVARQALIDAKFVQTPPEIYLAMTDYYREPTARMTPDGTNKLQDLQVKLGWQSKKIDLGTLIDQSLLP